MRYDDWRQEGADDAPNRADAIFDEEYRIAADREVIDAVYSCSAEDQLEEHLARLVENMGGTKESFDEIAVGLADFLCGIVERQAIKNVDG